MLVVVGKLDGTDTVSDCGVEVLAVCVVVPAKTAW
jgi:hypothetical protein